jgi:hypothetical protein
MEPLHYKHWPKDVPHQFPVPETTLYYNLEISASVIGSNGVAYYGSRLAYSS